jgi:uncharacterized integral membrane protein (TIGR00697 family)
MLYLAFLLAAVVVVYKVVAIGNFVVSEGTIIFPLTYLLGDMIAEVYGYQMSRRLIWFALICELIFTILVLLVIKLPGPSFWHHQAAYNQVLGQLYHVTLANLIAIPAGAFVNAFALTRWKILTKGRYFWLRSLSSTAVGEFVFCLMAPTIVFLGILPFGQVVHIIFSTYLVKLVCAVIFIYPSVILVGLIKRFENVDIYDYSTNFNPFRITVNQ